MKTSLPHVAAYWDNTVAKLPNATAAVYEGQHLSYAEADGLVSRLAGYLADVVGVGNGDRVCLALPNCLEFLLAYWATLRLGAIVAPVNTRLRADELQYVLRNCEPKAVVLHEQTEAATVAALQLERLRPHLLGVNPGLGGVSDPDVATPFSTALACGTPRPTAAIASDDLAVILHTSGTTGVPKGAMMRHEDLRFNVAQAILAHSFRHEDLHLLAIPCFAPTAAYSLLPTCAYLGSGLVIAPRPQAGELLELIAAHRCTTFIGVPTLFHLLLQDGRLGATDVSSLRLIAYSGSPMPPRTIQELRRRFPHVALHNFFGLTETISITHVLPSRDALDHADSIGKLLPEVHARIVDEAGCEVPIGEVGELCLRRDCVIPGYWNRPGLLEESIRDGWFHTGDLASVDAQGFFYVQGRKKEMIIVAGQNVYAPEVERVILTHDAVLEAAVVGVPATGVRAALGELVKAVVVLRPGAEVGERDIKRHCAAALPSYKVPQIVEFRPELPRNAAGKVLKRDLV
ncbi:MAG: AMP-binding protein [Armatimonadetes bacterium]|nr:AMP-binding protein [Armatimonadota bacterium]